jgi:hypothetical protein
MGEAKRRRLAAAKILALPDDIKSDIAGIVAMFWFHETGGGNCIPRAIIGDAVLQACGLPSRLTEGGMLYRAGADPRRDTLRFCLPNNLGGLYQGCVVGHAWLEVDNQIVDFSLDDWADDAAEIYASTTDPDDLALGPVEWLAPVPTYLWQPAAPLKSAWRGTDEPGLGGLWYGGWTGPKPCYANFVPLVQNAMPLIVDRVTALQLRTRILDSRC